MLLERGAGGAGLAGFSSCSMRRPTRPGLASGFMRLRTRLVRGDAGTGAFRAVRGLALAWPAIAIRWASMLLVGTHELGFMALPGVIPEPRPGICRFASTLCRPDRRCALLAAARMALVAAGLTVADTLCSFQRRPPSTRTAMKLQSMHSWSLSLPCSLVRPVANRPDIFVNASPADTRYRAGR